MNYRRGFQRGYCVITVGYIAVVCLVYQWSAPGQEQIADAPSATLNPGELMEQRTAQTSAANQPPQLSTRDIDMLTEYRALSPTEQRKVLASDRVPELLRDFTRLSAEDQDLVLSSARWPVASGKQDWFEQNAPPGRKASQDAQKKLDDTVARSLAHKEPDDHKERLKWRARGVALALVPPLLLYLFLFEVLRWVYRGFRSGSAGLPSQP